MKLVKVDAPRVTEDEATELTAYHLMMAHAYYQTSALNAAREIRRIMLAKGEPERSVEAALKWLALMNDWYAELARKQGP